MSVWTVHYFAGDIQKYGCSCCSNPTARWREISYDYRWRARIARWWIANGPLVGIQAMCGGNDNMYDPYITEKKEAQ